MPAPRSAPRSTLRIVTGGSPHALLTQLDADTRTQGLTPFDDETIVVQSRGMERWIRQELAVRRGIAAALDMHFPVGFCGRLAEARPADPPDAAFEREALTWRLTSLLGSLDVHADEVWAPLRTYLRTNDDARRFAFAARIARVFDTYRLYRPELLLAWEGETVSAAAQIQVDAANASRHAPWQRALWRMLTADTQPRHFARWLLETTAWLQNAVKPPKDLPRCVAVFGISTLPVHFVELLHALARFVPVTAYVLTPSAHDHAASEMHPLEQQLGGTSRELLALLGADNAQAERAHVSAVSGTSRTTLAQLQAMLRVGAAPRERTIVPNDDRSLLVHDCHSPVRELEVLHDQLLDAFAADPTLRPHDVLVMVPDVDRYAALAAMVFGSGRRTAGDGDDAARPSIPWRVADRAPDRATAPASAFVQLLALVDSRFHASAVLDLLASAPVCRAAGLEPADLEQITRWVHDARIHWGTDGLDRAAHGLPSLEEHTWRLGIDRLVAGHAAGARDALVLGVLPTAGDTGGDADVLGKFAEWVEQLALRAESLAKPRSLLAWSLAFDAALAWLVDPEGPAEEAAVARVHRDIARLRGRSGEDDDAVVAATDVSRDDTPVAFDVARRWLTDALSADQHDAGFLTGGLTICAMKPMRAIPFRMIAMLGLDDRAFPRRERRPAFDLLGAAPQPGDRDVRADDRQLMLDTLQCASERLHLSWVGRSQANNAAIAPSIVVSELLDQLDVAFTVVRDGKPVIARDRLLVPHALQPFSTTYFDGRDSHRFTFDARWQPPALSEGARPSRTVFYDGVAQAAVPAPSEIALQDLIDAWTEPAKWHARRVLQLRLAGVDDGVDDVEPLVIDALRRTQLLTPMLSRGLRSAGDANADAREQAREVMLLAGSGDLPPGALTALWTDKLQAQRQLVVDAALRDTAPGVLPPLPVAVRGADWTLTGMLDGQVAGGQRFLRGAGVRERDRIRAWIAHLARCAAGAPGETRFVGLKMENKRQTAEVVSFAPVHEAMVHLDTLVHGYRALHAAPLPFFPRAAFAWWRKRDDINVQADTVEAFTTSTMFASAEADDPYVALLWRGREPLLEEWDAFVTWSRAVCEPMAAAGAI